MRPKTIFLLLSGLVALLPASAGRSWTLRECIDYARANNIQVQSTEVARASAGVNLTQAKANQLPSLRFSTTQGVSNSKDQDAAYSGSYSLNAGITLYNGHQLVNTIRKQEFSEQGAQLDIATARNDIEISVTKSYLNILYANENLKAKRQAVESSAAQLERAEALFAAGTITRSDLAQFRSQHTTDKYTLTTAENNLAQARLTLKQLLELGLDEELDVVFPDLNDQNILARIPDLAGVYQTATEIMPQVAAAQTGIEAAKTGEKIAKGQYLPTVSLSAAIGTGNFSNSGYTFFNQLSNQLNESASVQISVPIFNNRSARSAVELARLQTRSAELSHANTLKELLSTVESLHQDALSAQSRYASAAEQMQAAEESYRLVAAQYEAGMKTAVDLLTEKNTYLTAQQDQIQAKYQAVLSLKLLDFYRNQPIDL